MCLQSSYSFFAPGIFFSLPSRAYIFYWLRAKFHTVWKNEVDFIFSKHFFAPCAKGAYFYLVNIHLAIMKYTRTLVYISYFSVACSAARKYGLHIDLFKKKTADKLKEKFSLSLYSWDNVSNRGRKGRKATHGYVLDDVSMVRMCLDLHLFDKISSAFLEPFPFAFATAAAGKHFFIHSSISQSIHFRFQEWRMVLQYPGLICVQR